MGKPLKSLLRRIMYPPHQSLVNLDDPWQVLPRLLAGRAVRGVIDAGAGNGRTTRKLLKGFPDARAWAFEPHPDYVDALNQAGRDNPRIQPVFRALSDRAGELEFYQTAGIGSSSLMKPGQPLTAAAGGDAAVREVIRVPALRLDDWWAEQDRPSVEVLKFDIQGGERAALTGGGQLLGESALLVYIEVLFEPLYEGAAMFGELDTLLGERGFRLYNLYKPHHHDNGALGWANAIYLHSERVQL